MKKLLFFLSIILLTFLVSCKKELAKIEGKTCWKCHVYAGPNPNDVDYDKTVCNKSDYPPRFTDNYGNDENADCVKQ